jgi:hypothetical protein
VQDKTHGATVAYEGTNRAQDDDWEQCGDIGGELIMVRQTMCQEEGVLKYYRLLKRILRGVRLSYGVWQISECYRRDPENVYNCSSCGVSNIPCEHWKAMLDRSKAEGTHD